MFGIFRNLAVSVLLRASFIERYIKDIFPTEREIVPFNTTPELIITVHKVVFDETEEKTKNVINVMAEQNPEQEPMRVVQTVTLKPLSNNSNLVARHAKNIV